MLTHLTQAIRRLHHEKSLAYGDAWKKRHRTTRHGMARRGFDSFAGFPPIVFDHFTGIDRFRHTIGERIAALPLLDDARYLHLHGTGVFYRQR